MKIPKSFYLLFFCSAVGYSSLHAQSFKGSADSLAKKIEHYGLKNGPSTLFTCFDKNVYVANENVWFTSYLLNYADKRTKPTILSVILVDDSCRSIRLEQKFGITDGMSFGHVLLPDSLPAGDYSFITYTNVLTNGKPRDIFIQPISIKEPPVHAFSVSLKIEESGIAAPADSEKVVLQMEDNKHHPIAGATAAWNIGDGPDQITGGTATTDQFGKYVFSIPRKQIIVGKNILNVSARYYSDVKNIKILLPLKAEKFSVKFFAEGGHLVDGIESLVGWEAKTAAGAPAKVTGVLYKGRQAIDTIETDKYGMGRFKLKPAVTETYSLRIISNAADTSYFLPHALASGSILSLKRGILEDSLQIKLMSKYAQKYFIVVHNFRKVFYAFPIEVNETGKIIEVNIKDLPKGLSTVTVLDSLQRPCAERIFFAHYAPRSMVSVSTDSTAYGTRQKVKIRLKLETVDNDPATHGIVSIACIQSSRNELKKASDIASYIYLKNELEALPVKENYMGKSSADRDYLEKVLLIKGWRKYKWQDAAGKNTDTVLDKQTTIAIGGSVTFYGKPVKRPANLMVITDSATNVIKTDAKGNFLLEKDAILTNGRKKISLLLDYPKNTGYKIGMTNVFGKVNDSLMHNFSPFNYNSAEYVNNADTILPGFNRTVRLKEVKIVAKRDDIYSAPKEQPSPIIHPKVNECGDWVCRYGILNCARHYGQPDNTLPVVGQLYYDVGYSKVVYKGCKLIPPQLEMASINGINYPKEFYGEDYSKFNPPEPEYQSTIYWKHACHIDAKKEVELSFYTSDLTGLFQVTVQGVSSNDLIYQKVEFNVKKK
ncbi:MAG TPA: hypothetical protein VG367_05865 [Mucilaginibacter sp.]|jgi:hypothetical protein|nr:hypothetical protein [Mucilaginibacter sp.]